MLKHSGLPNQALSTEEDPHATARQYVGIDLHRRRSVIVRVIRTASSSTRCVSTTTRWRLAAEVAKAGEHPEVVSGGHLRVVLGGRRAPGAGRRHGASGPPVRATTGATGGARTTSADATDLVDMLRLGRLPEAWIAPPACRELRELVRYRAKLVALRSGLKAQVHAVLAKEGVRVPMSDLFGVAGQALLDGCELARAYTVRVESLRDLIELYNREVALARAGGRERSSTATTADRAIQTIPGVGPVLGAVFVAEIGDVTGFPPARQAVLAGRDSPPATASPTPPSITGRSPNRASRLVRWAAIEAIPARRGGRSSTPTIDASPNGATTATSPGSPWPARSSPSSTTAYATARSAAWPRTPGEPGSDAARARARRQT